MTFSIQPQVILLYNQLCHQQCSSWRRAQNAKSKPVIDDWKFPAGPLLSDDTCITSTAHVKMEGDGWILHCGLRLLAVGYVCIVRFGCQLHQLTFVSVGHSCTQ